MPALESLRLAADEQRIGTSDADSEHDANVGGRASNGSPENHLDFKPEPYRLEAQRMIELIEKNRTAADDQLALVDLARLDARRTGYLGQLQRLAAMRETNDGFEIARRDMELRGPGEMLGTRQTGAQQFHIADIVVVCIQ